MKYIKILSLLLLVLFSCEIETSEPEDEFSCNMQNVVPKGERTVGIDLLDLTENNTFDQNILLAEELKVEFIALHLTWSSIEPTTNNYQDPFNALELLGQFAEDNNLKISLTIRPIDLIGKTVPADLENTRFNEVIMIDRFKSIVDFIFSKLSNSILLNFQIGNEIDGYDTASESLDFWSDYGMFLQEITTYIHSKNSTIKVGFTGTFNGLIANEAQFKNLAQNVDILGVTYYPLKLDFSVKEPDVVFNDFNSLVETYNNIPIYLQEVGYQSSEISSSNETKQAEFYCNLFKAWDVNAEKIKSINIVRLNDLSSQAAQESAAPYGVSGNNFLEFIRTLGIRTYENNGTNKQAFNVIKNNIVQRGW